LPRRILAAFQATLLTWITIGAPSAGWSADIFKDPATGTDLSAGGSWTNGVAPTSADVAIFSTDDTSGVGLTHPNGVAYTLGADLNWLGLSITNWFTNIFFNSGNTLTLGAYGINMSGARVNLSMSNNVLLDAAQSWDVASGRTLTLSGVLGDSGGPVVLTKTGLGTLVLGGNNTFAGDFIISGGTVLITNGLALGATSRGTFVTNSGTLNLGGTTNAEPLTLSGAGVDGSGALVNTGLAALILGPVTNAADAVYGGVNSYSIAGVISGPGALIKAGGNTLTLSNANNYTGATIVDGGTLTITGNDARLTGTSAITLNNGSTLNLGATGNSVILDRVPDAAPFAINRATLNLNGTTVAGTTTEALGSGITLGGGLNIITLTPATGREVELSSDDITRNNRATLLVRGTNLGSNGNNTARITLTTPPTLVGGGGTSGSMNISIVPWMVGDASAGGVGTNFVTYTPGVGLRPLDLTTEYDLTPISGSVSTRNYNAASEYFLNGSATLNALRLAAGTLDLAYTNTTLTVTSGAILMTAASTINNGVLNFDTAEGVIHINTGAGVTSTINSEVRGSGGLTVSGNQTGSILVLGGINDYSGPTTINGVQVQISQNSSLGATPGSPTPGNIRLANGTLTATADLALNSNRGIEILPGGGTLSVSGAANTLIYGGIIAGATTNTFTKSGAGVLVLGGVNTYNGPTLVTGGKLGISADSGLGTAPGSPVANGLTLNNGTLLWLGGTGALNANRLVTLTGTGTFEVAGGTLSYGGIISGAGSLAKSGSGTLVLTGANANTNSVLVNAGTLAVQGNGGSLALPAAVLVSSNATLTLGSTSDTAIVNRLNDAAVLTLNGGMLNLNGANNATPTVEVVGTLTNNSGYNVITLTPAAGSEVVLSTTNALLRSTTSSNLGAVLFVRGENLGGTGANSSRITFGSAPSMIGGGGPDGSTTISIIPWLVGDNTGAAGNGNTFVTYGANGLRPLAEAELESGAIDNSTSAGVGGVTNFTSAGETLTGNATLNALRVTGGTLDLGGFDLTNSSGALLFTGAATVQNGTLSNLVEGVVSLHGASPFTAAINSVIAGPAQLTVSGNDPASSLILGGANTFSNLVVNNIKVGISADNNLGALPAAVNAANIILAGGTLSNAATLTINTNRGITLLGGGGTFETPAGTTLTYGGIIRGLLQPLTKNGAGTLVLSGANAFTGTLTLNDGVLRATGNAGALGAGTLLINGGSLEFINDVSLNFGRATTIIPDLTITADRATAGTGVPTFTLGALTLGQSLSGGQTITIQAGPNASGNVAVTFGATTMTNLTGATTFNVLTNGMGGNTILTLGAVNGPGDIIKNGPGTLVLGGNNNPTFTGSITVNAGLLQIGNAGALGTPGETVTIADGATLDLNNQVVVLDQTVTVQGAGVGGNGAIINANNAASSLAGSIIQTGPTTYGVTQAAGSLTNRGGIQGNFTVTKVGGGNLILVGTNTYAAGTVVQGGTLTIAGQSGTLLNTTAITLDSGTTLQLGQGFETNMVNRLPDAAPINLNRGAIVLNGPQAAGANNETVGTVSLGGGFNTLTLNAATNRELQFSITGSGISRGSNAVLYVRGVNLGSTGPNSARVFASPSPSLIGGGGAAGSHNISIIPWLIAATNAQEIGQSATTHFGVGFATYDANGLRMLNPMTEVDFSVAGRSVDHNVTSAGENLVTNQTVNALKMIGGTLDPQSGRTLTVTSGAILATAGSTIGVLPTVGTVAFGSAEGVIHLMNGGLTLHSTVTGSGGLTVGSINNQTLTLNGTNTFTGPVTINGATVSIRADANLGNTANSLVLAGGTLTTTADITSSRSIVIGAGGATNNVAANTTFTLNGVISGSSTNNFTKVGTGTLVLGGANTYQGPTLVNAGTLVISSEGNLGAVPGSPTPGSLTLGGGTLQVAGNISLSANRWVNVSGNSTVQVNSGNTLTINGPMLGGSTLSKAGDGQLIISGVSSNSGTFNVNGGELAVRGNGATLLLVPTITIQSNATLTLGSTADTVANPNRVRNDVSLIFNNGVLNLIGSDNAATTSETVGTVNLGAGANTLTLEAASGRQVELITTNSLVRALGATALVRGTGLGTTGSDSSRVFFNAAPTLVGGNGADGTTTVNIVPFLVGDDTGATGVGNTFLTYGANGLRPLNTATELESGAIDNSTSAGLGGVTNFTSAGETLTGNRTLNALRMTAGTLNIGAGNTLTNTSGALLFTGAASITGGSYSNLNEAVVNLNAASPFAATIDSALLSRSNLTVSANNPASVLVLGGANAFSNLVVNNAKVSISSEGNLGISPGAPLVNITLNGGTLTNTASVSLNVNRNIALGAGGGAVDVLGGTILTVGGVISGAQSLTKNGTGALILNGTNSFTGSLVINNGLVRAGDLNAALGAGTVTINGGVLESFGSAGRNYNRAITVTGNTTNIVNRSTAGAGLPVTNGTLTLGTAIYSVTAGTNVTSGTANLIHTNLNLTGGGTLRALNSAGGGNVELTVAGTIANLGNNLTLDAQGNGRIRITGNITGAGGLIIPSTSTGTNILAGDNSGMVGGVTVNGGTLILTNGSALRLINPISLASGTFLEINAGVTLGEITGTGTIANRLSGTTNTLTIQKNAGSVTTFGGQIIDGGVPNVLALTKTGTGTLRLTNNNTYTGLTTLSGGNSVFNTSEGGELELTGGGRLSGTPAIVMNNGTTLTVGSTADTVIVDRIADAAGLNFQNGPNVLNFNGFDNATPTVELFNVLTNTSGLNTITLTPASGRQLDLTNALAIVRGANQGTLLLRGTNLGTNGAANTAHYTIASAPTLVGGGGGTGTKTVSIVPWVVGDRNASGAGSTFVTYTNSSGSANNYGFRPLGESEFDTGLLGTNVGTTLNVSKASETISGGLMSPTVNALRLTGGTLDLNAAGRWLTISSGALLLTGNGSITNGTLNFGAGEGIIHLMSNAPVTASFGSTLAGAGGLTIGSRDPGTVLTLAGTNNVVGIITLNGGTVVLGNASALNTFTPNSITLNGGTLRLNGNSVTISNLTAGALGVVENGGAADATLTVEGTQGTTFAGLLSDGTGAGKLTLVKQGTGTLTLGNNNTAFGNNYSGGTILNSGTLQVGMNNSLGNGPLYIYGGVIQPAGNNARTIPNPIFMAGNFTVGTQNTITFQGSVDLEGTLRSFNSTGGTNVVFAGPIADGGIVKEGANTLVLNGTNAYDGLTLINSGTIQAGTAFALGSTNGATFVQTGGTLNLGGQTLSESLVLQGMGVNGNGVLVNVANAAATLNGTISQVGDTTYGGTNNFTINGGIAGPGGMIINFSDGSRTLTLTGSNIFSGAVLLRTNSGSLTVSGNAGALVNTPSVTVQSGAMLTLGSTADTAIVNRLNNSARVILEGGNLSLNGANLATVTNIEVIGGLTLSNGFSSITLTQPNTGQLVLTNTSALVREPGAVALVSGTSLGTNGNTTTRITFSAAPTLIGGGQTNGPLANIVPFLIGDTTAGGSGNTFVTYTPTNGLRPLQSTELDATSLGAAAIGSASINTNYTSTGAALTKSIGVNALRLTNAAGAAPISLALGTFNLTNNSGALLAMGANDINATSGRLIFLNEAIVTQIGQATNTISAAIVAPNGFTYSANSPQSTLSNILNLTTANFITNGFNINGAIVSLGAVGALGDVGNRLGIRDGATLQINGITTTNSGIVGLVGRIDNNAAGAASLVISNLTSVTNRFGGSISQSGGGAVTLVKDGPGTQVFTGTNHLTGGIILAGGTLRAESVANALGAGAASVNITGGGSVLELAGTNGISFNRPIGLTTNATINVDRLTSGLGVTHTMGALSVTNSQNTTLTVGALNATAGTMGLTLGAVDITAASTNVTFVVNNNGLGALTLLTMGAITLATNSITLDGSGNSSLGGVISGSASPSTQFGLIKNGTGTNILGGANTFTNGVLINAGLVRATAAAALGAAGTGGDTAVTLNGGNLELQAGATAFGRSLTVSNNGTLFTGPAAQGAGVLHKLATLTLGNNTLTVQGLNAATGNQNLTFSNANINGVATLNVLNSGLGGTTVVGLTNLVGPATSLLNKAGEGILVLGSNANYTGGVQVNAGTLQLSTTNAFDNTVNVPGAVMSGVTNAAGATLDLNGLTMFGAVPVVVGGAGVGGNGTIVNNSATAAVLNSPITQTNDTTYGGIGNFTLGGAIGGAGSLNKVGDNTLTLGGANTFAGDLNVTRGTVAAGSASAFGTTAGGINISSGASVNLNGQTIGAENIGMILGNGAGGLGALLNTNASAASLAGNIAQMGDTAYGVTAAGSMTLSGIISGIGSLTKVGTGAGQLILTGTNSYRGETFASGGTLVFGGADGSATKSIAFNVTSNATLALFNTSLANNGNRIEDCAPIVLAGGTFAFANDGSAADYSEKAGSLRLTLGGNTLNALPTIGGTTSALTLYQLSRSAGATINFTGAGLGGATNQVVFTKVPTLDDGIIGGWATYNFGEFVKYADGSVTNLAPTDYNTGAQTTWTPASNVKLTTASSNMTANRTVNSVVIQRADPGGTTNNLGGFTLTIESGGLLVSSGNATDPNLLTNGFVTAGPNGAGQYELVTTVSNLVNFTNAAQIINNGANPVTAVFAGAGTNVLTATNTFTGGVIINGGSVVLRSPGALNASGANTLTINGGTLNLNSNNVFVSGLNGLFGTITNGVAGSFILQVSNATDNSFAGNIVTGTGQVLLIKTNSGTLSLSGNNTFTTPTLVRQGVINVQSATALGGTGGATIVGTNGSPVQAAVHIDGNGLTIAEPFILFGDGIAGNGALRNLGNTNTVSGAITIGNGGARIGSDSGRLNLTSGTAIGGSNQNLSFGGAGDTLVTSVIGTGAGMVTKDGSGTLILNAANTFSGGFKLNNGTVLINNAAALGASGGMVALNGGTLASTNFTGFTIGNLITIGGNITLGQSEGGVGPLTFSNQIDLGSGVRTLTINNPSNFFNGPIIGSGGITKEGPGALYLAGVNPFTGPVTINNGSIILRNSGAFNTSSNAITMGANGTLTLNGFNAYLGSLSGVAGGIIENANPTNVNLFINNVGNTTYAGTIRDGDGEGELALVKSGAGTLTLSGVNTYDGSTMVNEGVLKVGNSAALGTAAGPVIINAGGALDLNGFSIGSKPIASIAGSGPAGDGALVNNSATPAASFGSIVHNGNVSYGGSGDMTLSGNITGTGNFTKTGGGIVTLAGSNTFIGAIAIQQGTLRAGGTNSLGNNAEDRILTIASGATLDLNGTNVGVKTIAGVSGSGVGGNGAIVNNAAGTAGALGGGVTLLGDTTVGGLGNLTLSGIISGTNANLTKVGTNNITLSGANTFNGSVFINNGILSLGNAAALGTTPAGTFIANGATLNLGGQNNVAEPIWAISGSGSAGLGALVNNSVTAITFLGNVNMVGDTTIGGQAGGLTMSGILSGSGALTKAGINNLTLTATNTYSGATIVNAGTLTFSGVAGQAANSMALTVNSNATLTLDNSTSTNANRIPNGATLTMNGGTLNFLNAATNTAGVTENIGALTLGMGANTINAQASAGNSVLNFLSLARSAGAVVNFTGADLGSSSNRVAFSTPPTLDDGIIGGWATVNLTDFATYSGGSVTALTATAYNTNAPTTWSASQNVKIPTNLTFTGLSGANRQVNSMNIQSPANLTIDFGGNAVLTNMTGGLLVSGNAGTTHIITNGIMTAGPNAFGQYELIMSISNNVTLTNYIRITNNGANPVHVVFAGAGTNVLRSNSVFTGGATILGGTVTLSNAFPLGTNNLTVHGGILQMNSFSTVISNLSGDGGIIMNGANSGTATLTIRDTGVNTYSGIITNGGAGTVAITKTGTGILTLAGSNGYTGTLTVGAGKLIVGHQSALGVSTTGGIVISNGATLDLNGYTILNGKNLNANGITGGGYDGNGAMVNNSTLPAAWRGNFQMGTNTFTTVGGVGDLFIMGNISGTNRLIKVGANTLILSGGTNTWTGGLDISNGVVQINHPNALNASGVNIITNDATLRLNGNSVVIAGLSDGANGGGVVENNALGTNATLTISNSANFTYAGTLIDGGTGSGSLGIVKTNTGTLTLSGANTYSGETIINQGTLLLGSATALGSTVGGTVINSGGTLDLNGQTIAGENITSIRGAGVGGSGALVNSSGTPASFSGGIAFASDTTLGGSGNYTLSGVLSGTGTVTKSGSGKITLTGANTYTGSTIISGGVLNVQHGSALGSTGNGTTVNSGGALELQGGITTAEPITLNGSGISSGGALRNISGNNTVTGQLTLGGDARINSDDDNLIISGAAIAHANAGVRTLTLGGDGQGFLNVSLGNNGASATSLIKDGTGTWTLSQPNTFSGSATINDGTLIAQGSGVLGGTSQITVNTGGTLLLSGTGDRIKDSTPVTLAGGTLNTMGLSETVGVLTLTANSVIDLAGGASILRFDNSSAATWTGGVFLDIWNWSGNPANVGDGGGGTDQVYFGNDLNGLTAGQLAQIRFFTDSGMTLFPGPATILCTGEVVPVPEPATWFAIFGLMAVVGLVERRRVAQIVRSLRSLRNPREERGE
jgi:autotransporter-associated beta strand protein